MKRFFLGLAANYTRRERLAHTFSVGREKDCKELEQFLAEKYGGETILCKNGRSALTLALKAYFKPGDAVIVNGFTCYAVHEAVKAAKLVPVYADIAKEDLNFNVNTISKAIERRTAHLGHGVAPARRYGGRTPSTSAVASGRSLDVSSECSNNSIRGIIIQNSFGNPVDIAKIEKFAKEHNLIVIEDLAHCVGVKYPDGREAGTVGAATALSFGKDKSIDTTSGGAVVFRVPSASAKTLPHRQPRLSDHLRARFYPMFGALCRTLSYVHLGGILMRFLIKIRFVEKSADNKLDLTRKVGKFEAKLALKQLKSLKKSGEGRIREFYLVNNREEVLEKLKKAGYYFSGFWYEKPVSPERYYKKVHFPEEECLNAVFVAEHIINFPNYYKKQDLSKAREIIKDYLIEEKAG